MGLFLIGLIAFVLLAVLLAVPAVDWWTRVLVGKFKPWLDWKNDGKEPRA